MAVSVRLIARLFLSFAQCLRYKSLVHLNASHLLLFIRISNSLQQLHFDINAFRIDIVSLEKGCGYGDLQLHNRSNVCRCFFFAHMVAVVDSFQTSESFSCKLQLRKSKHVLDR